VLGALTGGALGGWLGTRETLYIAAAGMLVGPIVVALSPLRRYRGG
jgi:dipeptide/tripeptide permease